MQITWTLIWQQGGWSRYHLEKPDGSSAAPVNLDENIEWPVKISIYNTINKLDNLGYKLIEFKTYIF